MSQPTHTYGPTCHLAQTVSFSGSKGDDDIPYLKAHFFYDFPLSIDDPLSPAPNPTGSDSKSLKQTPQPFSAYDNSSLEEAWLGLGSGQDKKGQRRSKSVSPIKEDQKRGRKKHEKSPGPGINAESQPDPCKNDRDKCRCPSCPLSSIFTSASSNVEPYPFMTSNSDDSKPSKPSNKEKASVYGKKETTSEDPQSQQSDEQGNAYKPNCDDAHHAPMNSQVSTCCGDLEADVPVDHSNCALNVDSKQSVEESRRGRDLKASKRVNGKSESKHKAVLEVVEVAQRDGADEGSALKVPQSSAELDSKEHKAFERHGQSKGHEDFETHLKSKHQGRLQDLHADETQTKTQSATAKHSTAQSFNSEEGSKRTSEKPSKADMAESVTNLPKTKSSRKKDDSGLSIQYSDATPGNAPVQGGDAGTTGLPFVKLPSRTSSPQLSDHGDGVNNTSDEAWGNAAGLSRKVHERDSTESETVPAQGCKAHRNSKDQVDVPVGVSRLHLVQLPSLQMKPIYWSPVHDICAVTRGTWFYKDTMYPVEPPVANQLEAGYRELRPWSQTWSDELDSAIEVGAVGEEKIAHRLWPKEEKQKLKSHKGLEHHPLSNDPYCAALCFRGESAAGGTLDFNDAVEKASEPNIIVKRYSKSQVIYKDAQNAFILKPNLQPSAYYGRKPLQKIRKGTTVGMHVVRGFDWKSWEKIHPAKKTTAYRKAEENAPVAGDADTRKLNSCAACRAHEERDKVTDLILVMHGIGQKLSESLESFHFTHAINAFRRSINVELGNEAVQRVLRKDFGGIMVLPINWRSKVSFESSPMKDGDQPQHGADYSMKDITLTTIPAVRDFIEKVMLDIPYWMSIHKPKMILAVISEANRVYRLWCKNNPEFHKEGRVHIVAHSLGSAMALEILSKQPTSIPKLNLNSKQMNTKFFDFQTTNLFFCGSPAGFFLYLEKGSLTPRRGQNKPDAEHGDEQDKKIVGDVGKYGCLAVDNVYNIMHPEDPIAFQVNATVDPQYAASLKRAQVPSATIGFFESIGNAMRSIKPAASSATDLAVGQLPKPAGMNRLPSQLEMEVHDFTREEIAEKKFLLLNDNGQIDYFLCSDLGPLSFQYINMLSAHSCYWESSDFIRLVVIEVGRKPGRSYCLQNMKAVKIGHKPQKSS